ncbi:MAG: ATP phosphoribosyltransferase regulatory subunit [Acidithiobacillales bacterium SM1_46]|jgi:ATP phosphoribosyltransferase regulatory subunit|nr:MAG: ATP phosphoribosyltransferase regulatory subunit [Acidithiobacillales bacterium SM1_46]
MSSLDRWLLPEGIEETLPEEARRLERLRRRLLDEFTGWGYELVMPPLIEYLDSLLTGTGSDLDLQTFKLTDQLTGRLMGIRPDMTPQTARIDAHYLKRSAPVRLCYAGSVLHTRPDEFGGSREPLQIGAELFGHQGAESDAEVLSLMVRTLDLVGIIAPHLDLGHVGVFRGLARAVGLQAETEADVFGALQRKARGEVLALLARAGVSAKDSGQIAALLDLSGGAEVLTMAQTRYSANAAVLRALDDLGAVARLVSAQPGMPALHFDLAELSGYQYYTGIVFSAYVSGHGWAIAKGGRYDGVGRAFGRERAATGFGADLRQLLRYCSDCGDTLGGILAPVGEDAALREEVARLRATGERVVCELPGASAVPAELSCDRRLVRQGSSWVIQKI